VFSAAPYHAKTEQAGEPEDRGRTEDIIRDMPTGPEDDIRARLLKYFTSQPHDAFSEPINKYGLHCVTCPNCDPPNGKICAEGAQLGALAAEFYKTHRPPK
jgi:hypothetical protein